MREIAKYSGCFVCGDDNAVGLGAKFYFDETTRTAVCDITADESYAGYKHIFHGGITATLLDEIMIKALLAEDIFVVTAEMAVRFKRPVFTGDRLRFEGRSVGRKGVLYLTEGRAVNDKGETVATANGKYVRPATDLAAKLMESVAND